MRISTVAKAAGVSTHTLRYYERVGLLPDTDRLASGYREYDEATVDLVRFIKNAQELGFALREVRQLIDLRQRRSRSQLVVRKLAVAKVADLERRIQNLLSMKAELEQLVRTCSQAAPEKPCVIIEALDSGERTIHSLTRVPSLTGGSHVA
jgi:DNA-binding transcriptional MerR regulator